MTSLRREPLLPSYINRHQAEFHVEISYKSARLGYDIRLLRNSHLLSSCDWTCKRSRWTEPHHVINGTSYKRRHKLPRELVRNLRSSVQIACTCEKRHHVITREYMARVTQDFSLW